MADWLDNIVDKDILQDNLVFASLYITLYEYIIEEIQSKIKILLCEVEVNDGKEVIKESEKYKAEIKNFIVDNEGNKNLTKASFLWLVRNGAITKNDYDIFIQAKNIRNRYAHELASIMLEGVKEAEVKVYGDFFAVYRKIGTWWYFNIEAPIMGYKVPNDLKSDEIETMGSVIFNIVLDVLYNGKSEEFKDLIKKQREVI